jgi:hypothetical protein
VHEGGMTVGIEEEDEGIQELLEFIEAATWKIFP